MALGQAPPASPAPAEPIVFEGDYLHAEFDPHDGLVRRFALAASGRNLAGAGGLLQEGFGIGSYYVPNRRLNMTTRMGMDAPGRPVVTHTYNGDGPNIRGLHVERRVELLPGEASLRVTWTVENRGEQAQWMAPWVRNETPTGAKSRLMLPKLNGVEEIARTAYYPMARNWAAITDAEARETVYAVFDADQVHSVLAHGGPEEEACAVQAHFVPRRIEPGETWRTVYRVNAVRGLDRVDFATDEFAAQVDYTPGKLTALFSSVKPLNGVHINAVIVAANGRRWQLQPKRFDIAPNRLARCTYEWTAPADGAYDFLAQWLQNGQPVGLGADTRSPHGGIDTQFVVGTSGGTSFEAWTDAPFLLERGARRLSFPVALDGPIRGCFVPALDKVFKEDEIAGGSIEPRVRVALARNEATSFQLALRPAGESEVFDVTVRLQDLVHASGDARIAADSVSICRVGYVPVRVPSYYEGPTGGWPDVLWPMAAPITLPAGQTTPLWFTIRAGKSLPAGTYTGLLELHAAGMEPAELWIEVEVFDFTLPDTPALKTDFGFSLEAAVSGAEAQGGTPGRQLLAAAYLENALAHRVTLRQLTDFPRESARYAASLAAYEDTLARLRGSGISTLAVPPSLLDVPEQLAEANAFVKRHAAGLAFAHLAHEPAQAAWPRLLERMQAWKDTAPDIPMMVTVHGLQPFLHEGLDIWAVHSRVFDTPAGAPLIEQIANGREVWWYVHHDPPRPYPNFFLDFTGVEHRVIFWQAWAMGVRGMHYWHVNSTPPGQNPFDEQLDITPVNGNGLLVYPGAGGPINSIRWEIIRDGIQDYDYLTLFQSLYERVSAKPGLAALRTRADRARDLGEIVPSLTGFSRESRVILAKRRAIAEMIVEMQRALR